MRDLMTHDHGDVIVGGSEGEHAGVETDLSAGHREGVGRLVVDDGEFPAGGGRQDAGLVVAAGGGDDLQADLARILGRTPVGRQLLHLRELGGRERGHLALVDEDELRTTGHRDLLAADERQGREEQEQTHGEEIRRKGSSGRTVRRRKYLR
jgi:hypothetical protein